MEKVTNLENEDLENWVLLGDSMRISTKFAEWCASSYYEYEGKGLWHNDGKALSTNKLFEDFIRTEGQKITPFK